MKLKRVLRTSIFVLLLALFSPICTTLSLMDFGKSYLVSQDQTLYFQTEEIDLGDFGKAFLMDTTPIDEGVMKETNQAEFVSLPLASHFTFSNGTITVYHTLVPVEGYQLWIKVGWLDDQNQSHVPHLSYENLEVGTQVTSHSFAVQCCGVGVSEGQRFWLELQTSSSDISLFWGDPTHDSRVSYNGTASFIPEFPSFLILPMLMLFTLIVAKIRKCFFTSRNKH